MEVELSLHNRQRPRFHHLCCASFLGHEVPGQAARVRLRAGRRAGQLRLRQRRRLLQQRAACRLELRQRACGPARSVI